MPGSTILYLVVCARVLYNNNNNNNKELNIGALCAAKHLLQLPSVLKGVVAVRILIIKPTLLY